LHSGRGQERALTSKVASLRLKKGDMLTLEFGGGGGWGDPRKRDPERVRSDVLAGYVSLTSAQDDYAVAINPGDFSIDQEKTARLRGEAAGS
jgi:N-methylhydantoinase B/oxoprolinase/acetone carboxylase alpha subunit